MPATVFLSGLTMTGALIVAIGAQNAFVLRQGLRREGVGAIVLFCTASDLILIALGVAGLASAIHGLPWLARTLAISGIAFLLWYAYQSFRNALRTRALQAAVALRGSSLRRILTQAAGFTFLNPHVYLDTILLLGSFGARQPPHLRVWFVAGAATMSLIWFASLGFGARLLAPWLARPQAWRVLDLMIGAAMLVLAATLLPMAIWGRSL